MRLLGFSLFVACMLQAPAGFAVDRLFVAAGPGVEGVAYGTDGTAQRLGFSWDLDRWWEAGDWWISGQWEADFARMHDGGHGGADGLRSLGVGIMLRAPWMRLPGDNGAFIEAGAGVRGMSRTQFGDNRSSNHLQFDLSAGFGAAFGADSRYELGYRFWHVSNAGLGSPNPGFNFHLVVFGVRL